MRRYGRWTEDHCPCPAIRFTGSGSRGDERTHLIHHAGKCPLRPSQLVRSVRYKRLQFGVLPPQFFPVLRLLRLFALELRHLFAQLAHLIPRVFRFGLRGIDTAIHLCKRLLRANELLLETGQCIRLSRTKLLHACNFRPEVAVTLGLSPELVEAATLRIESLQSSTGLVQVASFGVLFATNALPLWDNGGKFLLFAVMVSSTVARSSSKAFRRPPARWAAGCKPVIVHSSSV